MYRQPLLRALRRRDGISSPPSRFLAASWQCWHPPGHWGDTIVTVMAVAAVAGPIAF